MFPIWSVGPANWAMGMSYRHLMPRALQDGDVLIAGYWRHAEWLFLRFLTGIFSIGEPNDARQAGP